MSYSKSTDFLKLPQWIGSDHPTFTSGKEGEQGDFNKAFSILDSNASEQASKLSQVQTTANSASGNAANALSLAQALSPRLDTLEDDLQDANTTLSNTATTAGSALAQANKNASDIGKLQSDLEATTKTANTANTNANTAKTNASTASTNASSALSKANTNATNISTLQSDLSALQTSLSALESTVSGIISMTDANFKTKALDILFPVGSIYMTMGTTSPATKIGGSWSKLTANRYLKTVSSGANTTGGNTSVSFKLTERQTPWKQCGEEAKGFGLTNDLVQNQGAAFGFGDRVSVARSDVANQDAVSFNLDPSYITVIAWRRTA